MPRLLTDLLTIPQMVTAALLAGCGSDRAPEVSFSAGGVSVTAGPAQYCDVEVTDCRADPEAGAVLRVPPGTPLEVSVPDSVSGAPWQVVFRYRPGPDGAPVHARSEVFAAGQRDSYTLQLPAEAQLETAEVQQFGAPMRAGGGIEFLVRGTWVLSVDDRS